MHIFTSAFKAAPNFSDLEPLGITSATAFTNEELCGKLVKMSRAARVWKTFDTDITIFLIYQFSI